MIGFVYDVASDIFLSIQYYIKGNSTYFVLTTIFVLAPVFFTYIAIVASVANKSVNEPKVRWCGYMIAVVALGPIVAVFVHILL
jgi:hypothetical protein